MTYVPHTDGERRDMLAALGLDRLDRLFDAVPATVRFPPLDLPPPASEMEVEREMERLAARNLAFDPALSFLGAGVYRHYRPATVDAVLQRGEFYSAYTPYQPEVSQGELQALFEYQSMVCRLTAMEVSNSSHYDGATALAEAVLLALNAGKGTRNKIVMSPAVHPHYRAVVNTYLRGAHADVAIVGERTALPISIGCAANSTSTPRAVIIQNPNFFGQCEPIDGLADAVHRAGALFVVVDRSDRARPF